MDVSFQAQTGSTDWTAESLTAVNLQLREVSLTSVLRWSLERFAPRICLATSFGPQSIVLMHQVSLLRPETTVFYLDTELLFPETYALRDRLQEQLGLRFTRVTADFGVDEQGMRFGPQLWARDPDQCCQLRKVAPLRRFLVGQQAWITGVRRSHTSERAEASMVEWDPANQLIKLNPLVRWDSRQVWDYLRRYDLPVNTLHAEGYPSIGCRPCTRAVPPGEDPRSGRWPGFQKTECGIHGPARPRLLRLGGRPLEEQAG